jgi:hypothetical protein
MSDSEWLEAFWGDMLSEEAPRIESAWQLLNIEDQNAVLDHLKRMISEDGWADVQRESAQAALSVIEVLNAGNERPQ